MTRGRVSLLLALLALAVPAPAAAEDDDGDDRDDDEVRVTATCTRAARAELRVRERDDDVLRLDFELRDRRRVGRWLVVVVHERRLVVRARVRPAGSSGAVRVRRTLPDFFGADTVTVRASGPGGAICRATASLESL